MIKPLYTVVAAPAVIATWRAIYIARVAILGFHLMPVHCPRAGSPRIRAVGLCWRCAAVTTGDDAGVGQRCESQRPEVEHKQQNDEREDYP